ncbi:MAG: hypothetical protein QM755_02875 [Luteolibacter sp.]
MSILIDSKTLIESGLLEGLWSKRLLGLRHAFEDMKANGVSGVDFNNVALCKHLTARTVDHYLGDYQILRARYGITDQIQLHRVAGLLASAICKFRPVIATAEKPSAAEATLNEHFAIHVGLSLCAECHAADDDDALAALYSNPLAKGWVKRFKYLLSVRNHTPESLASIFETLCITYFPKNFKNDPAYHPEAA